MYTKLRQIDDCPSLYEYYTAETLWNDPHTSKKMLEFHLDPGAEPASRKHEFIEKSVAWICERLNVGAGTRIADFGCGPGLYAERFAEYNAMVTGIDFSKRSIEYARNVAANKKLAINYLQENYLRFQSQDKFDLITMIYCDFCALSDSQRSVLLDIFSRHLKEDGVLLLDVFSMNAFQKREEASVFANRLLDGFWSEKEYYGFLKTVKYEKEHVVLINTRLLNPNESSRSITG